jgi:Uma2 family endonuclease
MSTAPEYEPRCTVDHYRQWEGDWELWNGFAVSMTPSPFGRHAKALTDVAAAFKQAVDRAAACSQACRAVVLTEIDWIVSRDTVVRPDLVVVCGGVPERHVESPPAVVVEVLSSATRDRDRSVKKDLYLREGVGWYVMIDPDEAATELFERVQAAGREAWHQHPLTDSVTLAICDHCRLQVSLGTPPG